MLNDTYYQERNLFSHAAQAQKVCQVPICFIVYHILILFFIVQILLGCACKPAFITQKQPINPTSITETSLPIDTHPGTLSMSKQEESIDCYAYHAFLKHWNMYLSSPEGKAFILNHPPFGYTTRDFMKALRPLLKQLTVTSPLPFYMDTTKPIQLSSLTDEQRHFFMQVGDWYDYYANIYGVAGFHLGDMVRFQDSCNDDSRFIPFSEHDLDVWGCLLHSYFDTLPGQKLLFYIWLAEQEDADYFHVGDAKIWLFFELAEYQPDMRDQLLRYYFYPDPSDHSCQEASHIFFNTYELYTE